jgi:hypothetical protein
MGTSKQPIGNNFMWPYDPKARYDYIFGHHRTTIANYNNLRYWPAMEGNKEVSKSLGPFQTQVKSKLEPGSSSKSKFPWFEFSCAFL